jgi:hypothetical protein
MRDQTSVLTSLMVFFERTRRMMRGTKTQAFSKLHPLILTLCQRAVCNARNCLAHQPLGRLEGETEPQQRAVQTLPFAVLVFPNPPVKVTAIVVMDGVSKDTMEFPIRSCEALQERVNSPKLILRQWHVGSVGVRTLGGGIVTLTVDGIPWGYRHPRICVVRGCGRSRLLQL